MKREWKGISKEDIEAEEQLALWLYPQLEGYQGLLAYISIDSRNTNNTVKLKKNIVWKKEEIDCVEFNKLIFDFLNEFDWELRPKINLLIQGVINNYYSGVDYTTVRDITRCTKLSKTSIQNIRDKVKEQINKLDYLHLL